uniref:Two-component sensor histidine kinase bacteria n=1 Tax=Rhizophora mucronata TaxID=61149 RepID=A0A2P2K3U7_RHIMU
MFKKFISIHVRHVNITKYNVETAFSFPQNIQGSCCLGTGGNLIKQSAKLMLKNPQASSVIIHNQYTQPGRKLIRNHHITSFTLAVAAGGRAQARGHSLQSSHSIQRTPSQ